RSGAQVLHARLHGAALVAWRAVLGAEHRVQVTLMLDDHAGAEKCRFDAAHFRSNTLLDFGNSSSRPLCEAARRNHEARRSDKTVLSAKSQYKGRPFSRSIAGDLAPGPRSVELRYDRSLGSRQLPRTAVPGKQVQEPRFQFARSLL